MQKEIELFIQGALAEDIGGGDHSSLACIPESSMGTAKLLVKESGILAGVEVAKSIAFCFDKSLVCFCLYYVFIFCTGLKMIKPPSSSHVYWIFCTL